MLAFDSLVSFMIHKYVQLYQSKLWLTCIEGDRGVCVRNGVMVVLISRQAVIMHTRDSLHQPAARSLLDE